MSGWNLPPGVTSQMIEDALATHCEWCLVETDSWKVVGLRDVDLILCDKCAADAIREGGTEVEE